MGMRLREDGASVIGDSRVAAVREEGVNSTGRRMTAQKGRATGVSSRARWGGCNGGFSHSTQALAEVDA